MTWRAFLKSHGFTFKAGSSICVKLKGLDEIKIGKHIGPLRFVMTYTAVDTYAKFVEREVDVIEKWLNAHDYRVIRQCLLSN